MPRIDQFREDARLGTSDMKLTAQFGKQDESSNNEC